MDNKDRGSQRVSLAQRDENDKQWYKDQINSLDGRSFNNSNLNSFGDLNRYRIKGFNYDLFNNIIDVSEFAYVCQPYGSGTGDLPASFVNRDIISPKIKVLLGMEMKMPFSWKVLAVNEEATTRKEEAEFGMVKEFVVSSILNPIRKEIELKYQQETQGQELTEDQKRKIQEQIDQEMQAKTPEEVSKYMAREHQDPAEALGTQLLNYLIPNLNVIDKFNKGWKHALISAEEIYLVGIVNGEPDMRVVNPMRFDSDNSEDLDNIEDGEWAVAEYYYTASEVVSMFGSELKDEEIDRLYERAGSPTSDTGEFLFDGYTRNPGANTIRIIHATWKTLREFGFLTYRDPETQEEVTTMVDGTYKLNKESGDISLVKEWIPETVEGWKIDHDIFVYMRPVQGQYKDLDNLRRCKLPYYGVRYDNLNSQPTSAVDRIKGYQYFYDIIFYRIELLLASDKGKILAANINAVPNSAELDLKKITYFMEANKILWLNPNEEGNRGGGDVTNMVKEIDMSLASNIIQYINLLDFIDQRAGFAIGVTKTMEGMIGTDESVTNTRQNLTQSSHIIQPYFQMHNICKRNVLQALIETAKVAYSQNKPKKLAYVLDDLSMQLLSVDQELLNNSTYGIFVTNSAKADEAKQAVQQLAQAALQNQRADLSDVIKIIRSDSIQQAEELLVTSEQRKTQELNNAEQSKLKAQAEENEKTRAFEREKFGQDKELIVLKESERRETELQKQAILSLGFNEDKDADDDGQLDVIEVYKAGQKAVIDARKMNIEEQKLAHTKKVDDKKLEQADKKLEIDKKKASQKPKTK